jgi:hypothetical protein
LGRGRVLCKKRQDRGEDFGFSTIFLIRSVSASKLPGVFIVSGLGGCLAGLPAYRSGRDRTSVGGRIGSQKRRPARGRGNRCESGYPHLNALAASKQGASTRELPPKSGSTNTSLEHRRLELRLQLKDHCLNSDGMCYDFDLAADYLRTHATQIFDLLREAYKTRVNIREWEEEIAAEAIGKTLKVWDSMKSSISSATWKPRLEVAIVQYLGRTLHPSPVQGPLAQAVASLHIQTSDVPTQSQQQAPNPPLREFAAELEKLLIEARFTPEAIADEAGIHWRTVYRHRKGEMLPSLKNLAGYERALSKVLGRKITLPTPVKRQKFIKTSDK